MAATTPGVVKIPIPMTLETTMTAASREPRRRSRPVTDEAPAA
jgi:hypothetical protein